MYKLIKEFNNILEISSLGYVRDAETKESIDTSKGVVRKQIKGVRVQKSISSLLSIYFPKTDIWLKTLVSDGKTSGTIQEFCWLFGIEPKVLINSLNRDMRYNNVNYTIIKR